MSGLNDNYFSGYEKFDGSNYDSFRDAQTNLELKKVISSVPPLMQNEEKTFSKILEDLQGNILRHHHRNFCRHYFIRFSNEKDKIIEALEWIHRIAKEGFITSAERQFENLDGPFCGFYLTRAGYTALGLSRKAPSFDLPFSRGMKKSMPDLWENGGDVLDKKICYVNDKGEAEDTHAMLLLASDKPDFSDLDDTLKIGNSDWCKVLVQEGLLKKKPLDPKYQWVDENGKVLDGNGNEVANKKTMAIEWFGFREGISQPLFFPERQNLKTFFEEDLSPLSVVLVKDPGSINWFSTGSFLAILKLEQDVKGFNENVEIVRSSFSETPGPLIGVAEEKFDKERQLAEAYILGRFRDGTPVTLFNEAKNNQEKFPENRFNYSNHFVVKRERDGKLKALNDENAARCPFFSHIRKVNPRSEEENRLIVRRGMLYDDRYYDPDEPGVHRGIKEMISWKDWDKDNNLAPSENIGMLFMSFQSSLEEQFEYIFRNWSQSPEQLKRRTGVDMLAPGADKNSPKNNWFVPNIWNSKDDNDKTKLSTEKISSCVRFKGGEYFFAPSITALIQMKGNSNIRRPR